MNQPVQLESWKKRWMCVQEYDKILQIWESYSNKFFKEKILKNPIFAPFCQIFFCDICTLEEFLNASELRKCQQFFSKCSFWGAFLYRKMLFPMKSFKKPANFNIPLCSQHIYPQFLFLHTLCKKIAQLTTAVFATFVQIISRFWTNLYWFI